MTSSSNVIGPCLATVDLGDYLAGRLDAVAVATIDAHVAECDACRARLEALRSQELGIAQTLSEAESREHMVLLGKGVEVGRYAILKPLGQGGMGVVYAAYDPQLDRRVALKLLRRDVWGGDKLEDGRTRLLREAQAMARLSHANVVSVFDAGAFGDQLYVAMEYVDGLTLRQWLAAAPQDVDAIVHAFVDAARGLAAAHSVGLIHRDFKPENVLRSTVGRICVADFGLARSSSQTDDLLRDSSMRGLKSRRPDSLGIRMTHSGVLLGTPAYMAPEQHSGESADARTDQFSFCVALYEALYGEHPFGGTTFAELVDEVEAGRIRPAPQGSRVPDRLRQIILRGLSPKPSDRWPSMDALIEALAPTPARPKRRIYVAAALAFVALAGYVGYEVRRPTLLCRGSESKLAGVWDAPRKQAIHDAFLATKLPFADGAWERTSKALDAYAQSWTSMRTDACLATRVRGDQSETLLDLRMQCLDEHLKDASALSNLLVHADPEVVEHASASAATLAPLDRCADAKQLTARTPLPADDGTRSQVDAVSSRIAEARALIAAGRAVDALKIVTPLVAAGEKLRYPPILASALATRGRIELSSGEPATAAATFKSALLVAESTGDDEAVASMWNDLMRAYVEDGKLEDAAEALKHGEAFVTRLHDPANLRAELDYTTGLMNIHEAKYDLARASFQRALATWESRSGKVSRDVERVVGAMSTLAGMMGDSKTAIELGTRALEIDTTLLGRWHPDIVQSEQTLGNAYYAGGRDKDAFIHYRAALDVAEKSLPPDHPSVAAALGNWAATQLMSEKRYAEALAAMDRVLSIQEKHFGADSAIVGQTLANIAGMELQADEIDAAQRHLETALAIKEKVHGPNHDEVARVLGLLANVAGEKKKYEESLALSARAIAIYEKTVGPQSLDLVDSLESSGQALVGMKQSARAIPFYERAIAIRTSHPTNGDPQAADNVAHTRFVLASAFLDTGNRKRAIAEAEAARAVLATSDPRGDLGKVDAFLARARGH